jgi:hypothetical protein
MQLAGVESYLVARNVLRVGSCDRNAIRCSQVFGEAGKWCTVMSRASRMIFSCVGDFRTIHGLNDER